MAHRSKYDLWIVLVVGAGIGAPAVAGLWRLAATGIRAGEGWILLCSGVALAALIALIGWPVVYEVTEPALVIRYGFLRSTIPLAAIQEIRPSRNPLSAPAWSLDRLRVDYRHAGKARIALISPEDQAAFLRDVARAAPDLTVSGRRAVRSPAR